MKKLIFGALAMGLAASLLSCGGGQNEGDLSNASKPFGSSGGSGSGFVSGSGVTGLIGIVVDSTNGNPIGGVTVTSGTLTAATDSNGNFAMPTIPTGTSVVSFNLPAYAPQSRTVVISSTVETSIIMLMTPNATTAPATFDPAVGTTFTSGTVAQLDVAANALAHADGSAPAAGNATVIVTQLSTSQDAYLEPGEYVVTPAAGGSSAFETFGGLDVRINDSGGTALTNVTGAVSVRIPISTRSSAALPGSVALFRFDATTGQYVEDGTAVLGGTAPNQFYQGSITRIGPWVAAQAYTSSIISVCVENQSGVRIPGARVQSDGIDYSGGGAAVTDATGVALVPMKRSAQAVVTATSPRSSNSATISAAQSAANFTLTPCLVMPTSGLTIRLTWGAAPSDLDSHLKGPNNTHVFFASTGSLSAQPFAKLDVDDVTSFGPEVITVARLGQSTYEYFVHNFSTTHTPGMTGSPARIEMRFGSQIRIFFPPAGEGTNDYWRVFQFAVASDCTVTFTSIQQWASTEPVNPVGSGTASYCP
jgi:hypothetical protein